MVSCHSWGEIHQLILSDFQRNVKMHENAKIRELGHEIDVSIYNDWISFHWENLSENQVLGYSTPLSILMERPPDSLTNLPIIYRALKKCYILRTKRIHTTIL